MEQDAAYRNARSAYQQSLSPFANPPHTGLDTVLPIFACPSDPRVRTAQIALKSHIPVAFTSYLGVAGLDAYETRDGILFQDSRINFQAVTAGTSNTLLLGERPPSADYQFGWLYAGTGQSYTGSADIVLGAREPNLPPISSGSTCPPGRDFFRPSLGFDDPCGMFHFWSPHIGGANFAFCDGSVKFLSYAANSVLPALSTMAGGESISTNYR